MEVSKRGLFTRLFLKEKQPFVSKQDVNWKAIKVFGGIGIGTALLIIVLLPTPKPQKSFHDGAEAGTANGQSSGGSAPPVDALGGHAQTNLGGDSIDYLYQRPAGVRAMAVQGRSSAMILQRAGSDARTELRPGTRVQVGLTEKVVVANQPLPVIGLVSNDVTYENDVAIPQGSKLYGEASFNEMAGRASISWKTIEFPDRRLRAISAIALGIDGQAGVSGIVHSDALKNTIGETISRFIGAYAQGSMQQGIFGEAPGGVDNGFKNAVAETAQDRANAWAEDMKKEKTWIELDRGQESYAVLDQSFSFRDPGATHGQ